MTPGICPLCGFPGMTGEPCTQEVCSRQGVHGIPAEYAERLRSKPQGSREQLVGQLIDEYLVVDTIGSGGFGRVFLALQIPVLMKSALKLMSSESRESDVAEALLRKFAGEAQALARLSHPNVVRLLKYGSWQGAPYLVMEYVEEGRTLKQETRDRAIRADPFPREATTHILRQVLNALDAAHSRGIVHRDIKPENVMLQGVSGDPCFVKVLDFGLAKFIEGKASTSMTVGTPIYMAPEQVTRKHVGPWTDLYAVGVLAFELMTGRRPYEGETTQEILAKKLDPEYDPVRVLADRQPSPELRGFFRRALAVEPTDRFRTAVDFRQALEAVVAPDERTRSVLRIAPYCGPVCIPPGGVAAPRNGVNVGHDYASAISGTPRLAERAHPKPRHGVYSQHAPMATEPAPVEGVPAIGEDPRAAVPAPGPAAAEPAQASRRSDRLIEPEHPQLFRFAVGGLVGLVFMALIWFAMGMPFTGDSGKGEAIPDGVILPEPKSARDPPDMARVAATPASAGFLIDREEATVGDYLRCVGAGRCARPRTEDGCAGVKKTRPDDPMNCIDTARARAFCEWKGRRLPSAAEWERAGAWTGGRKFPWADAGAWDRDTGIRCVSGD